MPPSRPAWRPCRRPAPSPPARAIRSVSSGRCCWRWRPPCRLPMWQLDVMSTLVLDDEIDGDGHAPHHGRCAADEIAHHGHEAAQPSVAAISVKPLQALSSRACTVVFCTSYSLVTEVASSKALAASFCCHFGVSGCPPGRSRLSRTGTVLAHVLEHGCQHVDVAQFLESFEQHEQALVRGACQGLLELLGVDAVA